MFPCNYGKGVEHTSSVRWTCIHVLMHIHIQNKVLEQNVELGHIHSATNGYPLFHVTILRGGDYMESQVDINTCTDACTHAEEGMV